MNLEVPVPGPGGVRGLRARRAVLLRPRARLRDRRREPDRVPPHRALRAERRRQVVAPARERRARAPRACRSSRSSSSSRAGATRPSAALARAIADAAGVEPGALVDVATRAQAERDVYLILDQAEEYFTYHGEGDGFDAALAALVDGPLRVNVLLSLREDTLAALDRLKGAIPNLFGNVLRLDHLDRAAGRAAIVKPLERWSELEDDAVTIEDELVGGRARRRRRRGGSSSARAARAPSGGNGRAPGIEAPYLQLVMQRLWDVERAQGSATLRAATLAGLGGAGQVVADHLERAIEALTPAQRDIAALLFDHLVTPSGTKIAHEASDLAQFAAAPEDDVASSPGRARATTGSSEPTRRDAGRSSTTCSRARCSAGRRATRRSGPSRERGARRGDATAGLRSSTFGALARPRRDGRARGLRVLAARPGARAARAGEQARASSRHARATLHADELAARVGARGRSCAARADALRPRTRCVRR